MNYVCFLLLLLLIQHEACICDRTRIYYVFRSTIDLYLWYICVWTWAFSSSAEHRFKIVFILFSSSFPLLYSTFNSHHSFPLLHVSAADRILRRCFWKQQKSQFSLHNWCWWCFCVGARARSRFKLELNDSLAVFSSIFSSYTNRTI